MAGGQERILKRRIRTVQSTKKITRAMELIAASRIVKAQARVKAARPYSDQITEVIHHLAQGGAGVSSPLLKPRDEIRKVAYVVLTADRGLCGAYNSTVIRQAERSLKAQQDAGRDYSLILVGKKADGYFRFRKYRIDATFTGMSDQPTYEDARQVARGGARAVRGRRRRPGAARLHPLPLGRPPGGRGGHADAARPRWSRHRRRTRTRRTSSPTPRSPRRTTGRRRATSSSRARTRSSPACCRATSRRASSPRSSTPRRRSTRRASGP